MTSTRSNRAFQACKIYFSEGRSNNFLKYIQELAGSLKGVALLDAHIDKPYNRTGLLLASPDSTLLLEGAEKVAREVLVKLDLRKHTAQHPRIGVIDHISCSPIPNSPNVEETVNIAKNLGKALGSGKGAVPVYFYGYASPEQASLASIRRSLGYFSGSHKGYCSKNVLDFTGLCTLPGQNDSVPGEWQQATELSRLDDHPPDFGPKAIPAQTGIVVIGASQWIANYNILLQSQDLSIVKSIARAVSERGNGIKGVEAMALKHDQGVEVACNLRDAPEGLEQRLLEAVSQQCRSRDIAILDSYLIGKSVNEYVKQLEIRF